MSHRRHAAFVRLAVLAVSLALIMGCLEGDPNPLAGSGTGPLGSSGTSGTSGSSGAQPSPVTPSNQCSKSSSQPITLTFRNRTPDITLNIFWVDYGCSERSYGTIPPGADHVQQTFVTHPWRLRDARTGALLKEFVPAPSDGVTVVELP